ncbi:MAG: hypothetical protein GY827_05280 [Cytophagales bacterium]|nr:hypothetical protein [Cytophagales bacterium]
MSQQQLIKIEREKAYASIKSYEGLIASSQKRLSDLQAEQKAKKKAYEEALHKQQMHYNGRWNSTYQWYESCRADHSGRKLQKCREQRGPTKSAIWQEQEGLRNITASKKKLLESVNASLITVNGQLQSYTADLAKAQVEFNKIDAQYQQQESVRLQNEATKNINALNIEVNEKLEQDKLKVQDKLAEAQSNPELASISATLQKENAEESTKKILIMAGGAIILSFLIIKFLKNGNK